MSNLILSFGDKVLVHGYDGEVIRILGDMVLVHFGGDSLHFSQEWCSIEDVKLKGQEMIKFKTAFIIEEKPKGSNHRMFKLIGELPSILQAEIDLVNTSTTRNNKVNRIKVFNPYDPEDFVIVSQNELDNLLSQCKIREDYQPVFLIQERLYEQC